MEVTDLRKQGFSPETIKHITLHKASHEADLQVSRIMEEIKSVRSEKNTKQIETYGINIKFPSNLSIEEKWQALEEETSSQTTSSDLIDDNEIARLKRSITRTKTLHELGFIISDGAKAQILAAWNKNKVGSAHFEIAQSSKENRMFLVRTILASEKGKDEVREDLIYAENLAKAQDYWMKRIEKRLSPL
ncbi:MAG: hypothetical protein Q8P26_05800 [Candidatus Levybacteria bacterium]|nr:hypothetical protein [Candidatus Levybacteria bacterium]